jgi:hypothetical protein
MREEGKHHSMPFWTSRQKRIGVFTRDQRRLENAIVCLNELEYLLNKYLKDAYRLDEYAIAKLITVHAEAVRTKAVAASGKPTILSALQALASQKEKELQTISPSRDSPEAIIRTLMCKAMLESINHQIFAWQKEDKTQ